MAHPQQIFFVSNVRAFLPDFFKGRRVLEVGSLNINGSVRGLFENCDYTGIDVGPGNGVDMVCPGQDFAAPARSYDVVISCEMMEHNPQWRETWLNMLRLVKSDGLVIMTCASLGRKKHGTSDSTPFDSPLTVAQGVDYYRNLVAEDFTALLDHSAWFSTHAWYNDHVSHDLYFFGTGLQAPEAARAQAERLKGGFADWYRKKNLGGEY